MSIFFALISYLGWGTADIFTAVATRKIGTFLSTFWTYVLGFLVLTFFTPFFLKDLNRLNLDIFFITVVLGFILWLAWPIFIEALRIGNASIVGTVAGSFGALVVVFSIIFFKESLEAVQLSGILVILVGILLCSINFADLKKRKIIQNKGTALAIAAMFLWGVYFTFIRIPTEEIGWFWAGYIALGTGALISVIMAFFKRKRFKKLSKKSYFNVLASAVLNTIGTVNFNYAITLGLSSIVAPVATSYPTLFVLLSRIVFKDKLTKQQGIGIILGLLGIVILALTG